MSTVWVLTENEYALCSASKILVTVFETKPTFLELREFMNEYFIFNFSDNLIEELLKQGICKHLGNTLKLSELKIGKLFDYN